MKARAIAFRFRMITFVAVLVLGFWAPWIEGAGWGKRVPLLEWLALEISRMKLLPFSYATSAVIIAGCLISLVAAWLRVWGSAYLGWRTVQDAALQTNKIVTGGPYRYVRNPLYLGAWLMTLGMAWAMPVSGAIFAVVVVGLLTHRLVAAEEIFLASQLGESYLVYLQTTPRFVPRIRTVAPYVAAKPDWLTAILAEIYPLGVFVVLVTFSWTYNNLLLIKGFLVCFGISLVIRAIMPKVLCSL